MTSCGVTVVADGTDAADERLDHALTNDTALGVMRYADAGYDEALGQASEDEPPLGMQPMRSEAKIGRNDPCPCGSGKKYKQCHGKLS